ncbi:sensor histidine kinase [Terriglobus aquaticus]|uniref:histidine kinase n=1 Tax=Terriglobus aquaticus TaxID=940139 RepID=A0ABW9KMS7_9BACT|nr:ATP-binding protein [Terriglobus aquaticus]
MGSSRPASDPPRSNPSRKRLPLGRSARRLSFERRLHLWRWALSLPCFALVFWCCRLYEIPVGWSALYLLVTALVWQVVTSAFFETVIRPLQTLSNIVAALRDEDFSFRARGAIRGDSLGDLALEINTLASAMQLHRNAAMDAITLADRVIGSMPSPVLAFDEHQRLRLLNAAAEDVFQLSASSALGRTAEQLILSDLLQARDQSVITPERNREHHRQPAERGQPGQKSGSNQFSAGGSMSRWSVRRTMFRLHGVPHVLVVLSDVAAALREEERSAWQRLIRVLSHEINNSLTPIKSVASMLRSRPLKLDSVTHTSQDLHDLRRGLAMIEDRAESLNRFLQGYQQLSRLPSPRMQTVSIAAIVERSALLERRLAIQVRPSPDLYIQADPDQIQQLLINLFKNAAEAAGDPTLEHGSPLIEVSWTALNGDVAIQIRDNGPGLANPANLFVPFYTTKPEGTGIGLTLCQQIVAAHQGSIRLRNRDDGSGCLVELSLPLLDTRAAPKM